jgi:hypothetical protein
MRQEFCGLTACEETYLAGQVLQKKGRPVAALCIGETLAPVISSLTLFGIPAAVPCLWYTKLTVACRD